MAYADDARGKMEDATAQIARLREQVETLMKERVTPAVADMAGRAQAAASGAQSMVRDQAEVVSTQVRQQPLMAILVAAGVGWLIGRVLR
jgi:ElaB/YqjD/DUF883 family membrane-anchored ribosome-binding protein